MTSKKKVLVQMKSLSNWGRWGKEDELGTINFITKKKTAKACSLVKDGLAVSCSRPIHTSTRPDMNFESLRSIAGINETRVLDFIGMVFHGRSITHIDSPSHFFWNGKMYNGRPAGVENGCDAEVLNRGIITRGVLLDIPGNTVKKADLESAEKKSRVRVCSGDVLLVRTGKGLAASTASWLKSREVAVIGSDTPNDTPFFHTLCLTAMGLWILDNCNLEKLARLCKEKKRWEFMIFIGPLRLKNVTGSPVNPIAVF